MQRLSVLSPPIPVFFLPPSTERSAVPLATPLPPHPTPSLPGDLGWGSSRLSPPPARNSGPGPGRRASLFASFPPVGFEDDFRWLELAVFGSCFGIVCMF